MSLRIPYDTIKETVKKAFLNVGLSEEQAEVCATIHTQSSADGVESHGLNPVSYTHLDVYKRQLLYRRPQIRALD